MRKIFNTTSRLLALLTLMVAGFATSMAQVEIPAGCNPLPLNEKITITGEGSAFYYFTAQTDGTLKITQWGTYDIDFFTTPEPSEGTRVIAPGYSSQTDGSYLINLTIAAGTTYFYYARFGQYDDITAVQFAWEGMGGGGGSVDTTQPITLQPQQTQPYTPAADGILTITTNNSSTGLWDGGVQYFLYTDITLRESVGYLTTVRGNNTLTSRFAVRGGHTYYLHNPMISAVTFTLSFEAGEVGAASITAIEPTPGTAFDIVNYRTAWNLLTSPSDGSFESITFTYVDNITNDEETIEVSGAEFAYGALRVPSSYYIEHFDEAKPNSYATYTIYGLKAGGSLVTNVGFYNDYVEVVEPGVVKVSYLYGAPIQLQSSTWPTTFMSAWEKGNAAGKATMTFDEPVYSVGEVSVVEGHQVYNSPSAGDEPPYSQILPNQKITVNGNNLILDFTGIEWNMPAGTSEVTVFVSGVSGTNGLNAEFDGQPVYQAYMPFQTSDVVITPAIVNYIEPADNAPVAGFTEGESITLELTQYAKGLNPTAVKGTIYDAEGDSWPAFEFSYQDMRDMWFYEIPEGQTIEFQPGETYTFKVEAYNGENVVGSENFTWFGVAPMYAGEAYLVLPNMPGLSQLNAMQVVFGDYAPLTLPEGATNVPATLTLPNGTNVDITGRLAWAERDDNGQGGVMTLAADDDNSILFQFNPTYNIPGEYTLTLADGVVDVNGYANYEVTLSYIVVGEGSVMNPASLYEPEKEILASCGWGTFTWDYQNITLVDASKVKVKVDVNTYTVEDGVTVDIIPADPNGEGGGIALWKQDDFGIDDDWGWGDDWEDDDFSTGQAMVVGVPFDASFDMETYKNITGVYTFILEEGAVVNDEGAVNPYQEYNIYVLPLYEGQPVINPEVPYVEEEWDGMVFGYYENAEVPTLDKVTIKYGNNDINFNEPVNIQMMNPETWDTYNIYEDGNVTIEENTIIIDVAEYIKENGTYNIFISEGDILIGSDLNNMSLNDYLDIYYDVTDASGIKNVVEAQDGRFDVYTVDGMKVLSTENADALGTLEPGRLYIINGKKVFLRK